jgi:FeS assembly SUF system protein
MDSHDESSGRPLAQLAGDGVERPCKADNYWSFLRAAVPSKHRFFERLADWAGVPPASSEKTSALVVDPAKTAELQPAIVKAISTVFDPEIPVNIYELGLIYDVLVDARGVAGVRMTLTAPGCPVAHTLPVEVANKVKAVEGVTDAIVDIVWEPAWTKDRMSDAAKLQLGMW